MVSVAHVPNLMGVNPEPELTSTRQTPLVALRTAMSALPSALKSPTFPNWPLEKKVQTVDAKAVPVLAATTQALSLRWPTRSSRPSPVKSAANTLLQVSSAFQRPKRLGLNADPVLVSTCQAPLA